MIDDDDDLESMPRSQYEARRWVKKFWVRQMRNADTEFVKALGNEYLKLTFAPETDRIIKLIMGQTQLPEDDKTIAETLKTMIRLAGERGCTVRELRSANKRFRGLARPFQQALLTALVESGLFVYAKLRTHEGRSGSMRNVIMHVSYVQKDGGEETAAT